MSVLLTRRAVLQAAMETTYNDPATVTANDGVLVSEPMYSADPTILERDFTRDTLSQQAHIVGRMMAKMEFTTELRGNGKAVSGLIGDAPIISRLFRACGFALTAFSAAHSSDVFQTGDHLNPVVFATGGAATNTELVQYTLTITTAGASGVAQVTVTSDTIGEGSAAAAITTAVAITLGTSGVTVTPTFTGDLALGQTWTVWALPPGLSLDPVSKDEDSITLVMNKDGVEHTMPGAYGTFEITATAGEFATVKWTFTGTYVDAVDAPLVSAIYEKTLPAQVENARMMIDGFATCIEKLSYNHANDVQIRPCVNAEQGYNGTRIVGRKPEGGIDPEAALVADYDFWGKMRNAERMPFQMRVGTQAGNTVWVLAPSVQYTRTTYGDRQGLMTYDAGLKFAGYQADDEVRFYFA